MRLFFCRYCSHGCYSDDVLQKHAEICKNDGAHKVTFTRKNRHDITVNGQKCSEYRPFNPNLAWG